MTDWLMVIITAIYVVATILICIYNGKSAEAAKEQTFAAKRQIEEMIKQFNETNRPVVTIRFDIIRSGLLCFVLENIGPVAATDIQIKINAPFLDNIEKYESRSTLREISKAHLFLSSNQKLYIPLAGQQDYSKIAEVPAEFVITYNGKYSESTQIDLWQYRFMLVYNSELEDISQHLKKIEKENKGFHTKLLKQKSKDSPVNVLVHTADDSRKFELYKAVCLNPGYTTAQLAEKIGLSLESTLDLLIELDRVDSFIQYVSYTEDDSTAKWYKR